jgi:hypothetical protein
MGERAVVWAEEFDWRRTVEKAKHAFGVLIPNQTTS